MCHGVLLDLMLTKPQEIVELNRQEELSGEEEEFLRWARAFYRVDMQTFQITLVSIPEHEPSPSSEDSAVQFSDDQRTCMVPPSTWPQRTRIQVGERMLQV